MSITNRHPLVEKIINGFNSNSNAKLGSKWNIIFLETKKIEPQNILVKNHLYQMTIEFLNTLISIDKIFIYARQNLHTSQMFPITNNYKSISLIELPIGLNYNSITLFILDNHIKSQSNIIFFC